MPRFLGDLRGTKQIAFNIKGSEDLGPPVSGAYKIHDIYMDLAGVMYICTASGVPGTWEKVITSTDSRLINARTPTAHATTHKSGGTDVIKLDELDTPTDITTLNASTTSHGLLLKAVAPSANLLNVVGIANGETVYSNKPLFDSTDPAVLGTTAPGTSLIASHRDHVHGAAGSDTQVLFNNSGAVAGDSAFSWNNTTKRLTLAGDKTYFIKSASDVTLYVGEGTGAGQYGAIKWDATNNRFIFGAQAVESTQLVLDNATGNIGMGTASPTNLLTIFSSGASGTSNTRGLRIGEVSSTGKYVWMDMVTSPSTGNPYFYIQSIHEGTDYRDISINPLGGSVGIGTQTPIGKIHAKGSYGQVAYYETVIGGGSITVLTGLRGLVGFVTAYETSVPTRSASASFSCSIKNSTFSGVNTNGGTSGVNMSTSNADPFSLVLTLVGTSPASTRVCIWLLGSF